MPPLLKGGGPRSGGGIQPLPGAGFLDSPGTKPPFLPLLGKEMVIHDTIVRRQPDGEVEEKKGCDSISIFKRKPPAKTAVAVPQTGPPPGGPFAMLDSCASLSPAQTRLYYTLREAVPVIDAAVFKLVRLTGGFRVNCGGGEAQAALDAFLRGVQVGGSQRGVDAFIAAYFEQLLTCGTAVGEIVTDAKGRPAALYNASLDAVELRRAPDGLGVEVCARGAGKAEPVQYPELVMLSVLNPEPGQLYGNSLLKGLPFVSAVLLKIFAAVGANWERVGNIRFAVTYKPQNDALDRAYAKDRAMQVAKEWGECMRAGGAVRDFVAVGDVQIKVIGADNQILDSEVPARQMLEQIVAKTGLPPFMLGLSWSSTERMSSQQADALTSELEAYRRILTPVIAHIADVFLRLNGFGAKAEVEWDDITMQDQIDLSRARLFEAQAESLKTKQGEGDTT